MNIAEQIKNARLAKGLSQKQVALELGMNQSQYSRIENGKTDPTFTTTERISRALGIALSELLQEEMPLLDINSYDKTAMEKLRLIEGLEASEQQALFALVDGLVAKQKLKRALSQALSEVE